MDLPLLISAWHKHCSIPLWDDQNWLPSTVTYAGIQEKVKTGCYDAAQCKLKIGNVLCVITKTVVIRNSTLFNIVEYNFVSTMLNEVAKQIQVVAGI